MHYNLNIFKLPLRINYRKRSLHSHWTGTAGTLLFAAIFVCVAFFFGTDFYLRENPSINIFEREVENYDSLLQKVEHDPKLIVGFPKFISHRILSVFLGYSGISEFTKPLCSEEEVEQRISDKLSFLDYYCFDLKSLEFDFDVRNYLIFTDCANTDYSTFPGYNDLDFSGCTEMSDREKSFMFNILINIHYPQVNFNMNNYEQPISYTYQAFTATFQENRIVTSVLQSQFVDVNDDKGWIFKDESNNYGLTSILYLENTAVTKHLYDYRFKLAFSNGISTHKRIYTKIQNLAAEIGGFLKAILILIKVPLDFISASSLESCFISDFFTNRQSSLKSNVMVQNLVSNCSAQEINKTVLKPKTARITGILRKIIIARLCCRKKRQTTIFRAAKAMKGIFSVENILKFHFEMDIIKRFLFSEAERKVLQGIKQPDINNPCSSLSKRYLIELNEQAEIKEEELEPTSQRFNQAIEDYI